jgi:hypothetical protein
LCFFDVWIKEPATSVASTDLSSVCNVKIANEKNAWLKPSLSGVSLGTFSPKTENRTEMSVFRFSVFSFGFGSCFLQLQFSALVLVLGAQETENRVNRTDLQSRSSLRPSVRPLHPNMATSPIQPTLAQHVSTTTQ